MDLVHVIKNLNLVHVDFVKRTYNKQDTCRFNQKCLSISHVFLQNCFRYVYIYMCMYVCVCMYVACLCVYIFSFVMLLGFWVVDLNFS